ncbi:uncharacterized protein LOC143055880 isoform X2 [Mytilus galloprovincialis]|uniref:uncharacterized protein LOC143055880 isoform X2 n=1 Tax=Mytilus galloprovincialis TaxID=29158 RepID=UPI003F7C3637
MLHCLTIWAILINIAYGVNQDCYFIPDPRLACVEFISLSKGVHGCKHLKDSVLVTGISKEWIEIIEINGVETMTEYVRFKDGTCSNKCCGMYTVIKNQKYSKQQNIDNFVGSVSFISSEKRGLLHIGLQFGTDLINSIIKTDHNVGKVTMDCSGNPCVHGQCSNTPNGYYCVCYAGFSGPSCAKAATSLQAATMSTAGQELTVKTTLKPCVDEPLINCKDPAICHSPFRGSCPLSCEMCVPVTTKKPCDDNKLVQCQDPTVCSSILKQYCPVSCNLCDSKLLTKTPISLTTAKPLTPTGWLHVDG